jgi:hypothetical protein
VAVNLTHKVLIAVTPVLQLIGHAQACGVQTLESNKETAAAGLRHQFDNVIMLTDIRTDRRMPRQAQVTKCTEKLASVCGIGYEVVIYEHDVPGLDRRNLSENVFDRFRTIAFG